MVLARLWPVRVHLATDSNAAEAGDGPPPAAGEMGQLAILGVGNLFPCVRVCE